MASVELHGIKKSYGLVPVIHGLDLRIADGEFVALVGPSGCGKSTTLRIISGLEDLTSGDIWIGRTLVNDLDPKERNIAMVFQNYALYPHMSAEQNMSFNLELSGTPKAEIKRRVAEAARMLDIEALLKRRPGQLSGGQRQRVAMGRAIVRNPAVFLFDEPLSNLDAKLRVQMRSEIKALHQKVGVTSVYVTHDQVEAMTLADRVVVMNNGFIEQEGSPLELYRQPANRFVAGFIGSPAMNFLDATLRREAGSVSAVVDRGFEIALAPEIEGRDGHQVTIGIRPEHLALKGQDGAIRGDVALVEPTGGVTYVTMGPPEQRIVAVVSGTVDVRLGERLTFSVEPQLVHVFDRESGKRLSSRG